MPVLDFCACTRAQMHTHLFSAMVSRMQHLYSNTPILTPAQRLAPRMQGQECNCPAPLCLHSFASALTPAGHHPRLVRTAENSAMPQKWNHRGPFVRYPSRCTVGRSRLRTLAVLSSTQLKAPRRCLPAHSVFGWRLPRKKESFRSRG